MSIISFLSNFKHKQEMRESKDEIMIGELVRVMIKAGYMTIGFRADNDMQYVRFKPLTDEVLHSVTFILDRKTGGSAIQEALIGSKAVLSVQVEIKNYLADPDDLIHMYRTDLQNIFKVPILGDVRLDHQLNSVLATKKLILDIDNYVLKGGEGVARLTQLLNTTIEELRNKLAPYKKA